MDVLLVEDQPVVSEATADKISRNARVGSIEVCCTAERALHALQWQPDRWGLIFLDLDVPGAVGLSLAALGLHGLTAFAVSQRRREIAIRVAVGAAPRSVVWLVLRQSALLAIVGAAAGFALAVAATSVLGAFLIGLGPLDPTAFTAALLLLAGVMLLSSWTPARGAAGMDPINALRAE